MTRSSQKKTLWGVPLLAWLGFAYVVVFVGLAAYASGMILNPDSAGHGPAAPSNVLAIRFHPPTHYPKGPLGRAVKAGQALFMNTTAIAGNKLSCTSCHIDGGTNENVLPLVGVATIYPTYNSRAKAVINLTQRIDACLQYSEAGHALSLGSTQLVDLNAYLTWLSSNLPVGHSLSWMKKAEKPSIKLLAHSNVASGAALYKHVCYYCHGTHGQGFQHGWAAPPLWGPGSYAQGAGMSSLKMLTSFIKTAMPVAPVNGVNPGSLTVQQAQDIAAYVLTHARPQPGSP